VDNYVHGDQVSKPDTPLEILRKDYEVTLLATRPSLHVICFVFSANMENDKIAVCLCLTHRIH